MFIVDYYHMNRYNPKRLADVDRFLKLNISKEKELQEIVEFAAEVCGSPIALITLMDGETQFVKFHTGADIDLVDYNDTFCQYTLNYGDLHMVEDAIRDDRFLDNPFVQSGPYLRFYAGMPLISEKGNAIGTLCVFDLESHSLSHFQQVILRSLSEQVTSLLEFDVTLQILKEKYEESNENASILLTYFNSSSSCHLLMDKNMQVIAFNQTMANFIIANDQPQIVEGISIKDYVPASFLEEFTDYFNRALSGEVIKVERHLDYTQGMICWYMIYESALDSNGELFGVSLNATDITSSVSNQRQLNNQADAIIKINDIQANDLAEPIDQIIQEAEEIKKIISTGEVEEFHLLQLAVAELKEKKAKIITVT
ncbi:hypothetical protein AY601_1831 [Pedobacter cryoconitis]|uniref:GAF domain-containing protein n=2 Tax=Pedobacter cryoconitis TaxID=188932 RepID=A0A127VBZ8_9SPHI|nr:hypothetical protein AY601_1831 [Pedobacter cryoconitis]